MNNSLTGFGMALTMIDKQRMVARHHWDKNQPYRRVRMAPTSPSFEVRTSDDGWVRWHPTHEDLLADDWYVVEATTTTVDVAILRKLIVAYGNARVCNETEELAAIKNEIDFLIDEGSDLWSSGW